MAQGIIGKIFFSGHIGTLSSAGGCLLGAEVFEEALMAAAFFVTLP
jgi:hypothetical protein